ncbi:cystathionine beta-synthase [Roseivirga ehrenbergii]|uniref:Cystathionine beta-synthase n=1 Tax=Roseivirga ehrenbergii (strain DSM 102268 / JCM 13514 / KCTC 12282 / NCIMB 14502 / KMM 6017) TaxID=279360 RepID=A0A150XRT9_ROSEK|nr:pyridoxal-phosphate dependent enzyme [Roseivirga ehrenbergii]KYG81478.1 cystathionine beta-synthase [Roseivirga ehrenbergii]TCL10629.1 cystathionine beta-synthase [Roseivirga ehrenbergii]
MKYYNSIIETIGDTPLVKLNSVTKGIPGTILAKVEYFNPGNSMKDRMAVKMIEDAEKAGLIKPGGTIIEGTSGNTGMGLALAAIAKGYKCIFTLADKQSQEKMDILKAVGAEVIVCPTNVSPDDPRSYYSVAKKLNADIPNSYYPNQYDNMSNSAAHYETTGPEIWRDTEGKITHYAAGVGTGGSMCGTSKYLKEQNADVVTVGIDTYGSVFKKYKETGVFDEKEIYSYLTEGIGEDILPKNVNFDLIDHFVKVTDKDGAIMTRRLSREEGLFCGWSCGSAVAGALEWAKENMKEDDVMVIILPDHGTRYLGKVYNDDWMKARGFIENRAFETAADIMSHQNGNGKLTTIAQTATVAEAIKLMTSKGISQLPVVNGDEFVGSLVDSKLLAHMIDDADVKGKSVSEIMDKPFQFVSPDNTLDVLSSVITKDNPAVMIRDKANEVHIITRHDLLQAMASN